MKLILKSDVKSLGRKGDVVDVAKGYARNYLLPKKLAVVANSSNLKFAEALREIETFSGFRLEAEQIDVEYQVKEIGLHSIFIVLGPDAKFETTLEIIPETK